MTKRHVLLLITTLYLLLFNSIITSGQSSETATSESIEEGQSHQEESNVPPATVLNTTSIDSETEKPDNLPTDNNGYQAILEENRLLKSFQSDLLSTVYWSLTTVFGVLLLIAGFNWYANFRMHERDRQSIRDEVEGMVSKAESELIERMSNLRTEVSEDFEARVNSHVALFADTYVSKDAFTTYAGAEREAHELQATSSVLNKVSIDRVAAWMWEQKGVPVNALTTVASSIEDSVQRNIPFMVQFLLEDLDKILTDYFTDGTNGLSDSTRSAVMTQLDKAKELDAVKVEELKSRIELIPEAKGLLGLFSHLNKDK